MNPDQIPKTKAQLETEKQLETGEKQSADAGGRGFYKGSGVAGAAMKTTPVGKGLNKLVGALKRNKKGTAIGSGILGTLVGVALFITSLAPFQLVHMMEVMEIQKFSVTERSLTLRSIKALRNQLDYNRQYVPLDQRPVRRQVNRHLRTSKFDNRIANLDYRMTVHGLNFEMVGNRPVAIIDKAGNRTPIDSRTYRTGDGRTLTQFMDEVAPDRKLGRRARFFQTMNSRMPGGWVRKFFTGRSDIDRAQTRATVRERFKNRVRGSSSADANTRLRDMRNADPEIDRAAVRGDVEAIKNRIRRTDNIVQVVALACIARSAYETSETLRTVAKYAPYMAISTTFLTMRDQLKTGGTDTVTSEELGAVMDMLHDHETNTHFDQTETWKRASGQGGGGVGLAPEKRFDHINNSAMGTVFAAINRIPGGDTGATLFCAVAMSSAATTAGLAACFTPQGAAFCLGTTVAVLATFQLFGDEIMDWLAGMFLRGFNPCTAGDPNDEEDEPDPPDQLFNCIGAGLVMADTEHARSIGALPLDDNELDELQRKTAANHHDYQQSRGFAWRWLNPQNPYSVTAKVAISLPNNLTGLSKSVAKIPNSIVKSLSSVVPTVFGYGYQYDPDFDYYGLSDEKYPQFGFMDEEMNEWENNEGDWYNKVFATDVDELGERFNIEGSSIDLLTYYCWHTYGIDNIGPWTMWHDNEGNSGPRHRGTRGQPCGVDTWTVDESGNRVTANKHNMAYNSRGWPKEDDINDPEVGFIQCTQTPYFEAEELDCFGENSKFDRRGTSHLPKAFTKNISAYMVDRYISDNQAGVQMLNEGKQAHRTFHFLNGPDGSGSAPSLAHCVESNKFVKRYIDNTEFQVRMPPAAYCYVDESNTGPHLANDSFDPRDNDSFDPRDYEPNGFLFSEDPYAELPRSLRTGSGGDSGGEGGGGGGIGRLPVGSSAELARKILESGRVTGSSRYMEQLQRVADGQPPCNKDGAFLSETLLGMILALTENYTLDISSLNRYCTGVLTDSGTASYHYGQGGGRAVDFRAINGQNIITPQTRNITKQLAEDAARMIPAGSGIGQSQCGLNLSLPPGIRHFRDECNHIHIQVPH